MKLKILILAQFIFTSFLFCQNHNPFIEDLMNQANLDSLVSFVRILSGEDSVMISDTTVLISHRISYLGNDLAADYIKQKLESYELETYDQRYSEFGRNIYSIQRGTAFPDIYFIYCAHYDAVTEHCADDNASGVAGVLEAARILSNYQFDYTIIYALWDEEEYGGIGSRYFAASANSNNMDIQGVLNFEMGGWDSNNDGLMDIHT
ncbi:MAG: M20/M25/M40 family metallo-hydrolase [Bacteroidetes bacterium]|nr:M20/M25/M40 family metallo-hydrolase [Bacteroidota bacterium]